MEAEKRKRKLLIGYRFFKYIHFRDIGMFEFDCDFASGFEIIEQMRNLKELIRPHSKKVADSMVCGWKETYK